MDSFDADKVDIEKMAKETGISIISIKKYLGIYAVLTTLAEAKEAYINALLDRKEGKAALVKWRNFSAIEVEKAATLAEAKTAYINAPSDSKEGKAAVRKLATFFIRS